MAIRALSYRLLIVAAGTLALSGCGSNSLDGDDSSTSSSGSSNASAAGIWNGTDSASGLSLTGIIDSAGEADFIRSDGTQYSGTVEIAGNTLDIALNVNSQTGSQFADGSVAGVGTLNATVTTGTSITGGISFTTTNNNTLTSNWTLSFDTLYNNTSSLSAISGNYTDAAAGDPVDGATVSISGTGAMTAQSSNTGCVLNGQITIPNTSYDAYAVTYTLASCTGNYAVLNGVSFAGLGLLNSGVSPAQVVIGVRGQDTGGDSFGITSGLTLN